MTRYRSRQAETEDVNPRRLQRGAVKRQHISRWAVGRDELAPGVVDHNHLDPSVTEVIREIGAGSGVGQLLLVSATGQSFASGGDYVEADLIEYQYGFDGVTAAGDTVLWPVDAVGEIQVEFVWDTYEGGGTIEIEVDGTVPDWGLIATGSTGAKGCKRRGVHINEGAHVKIKVTQSSGSAKTGDVVVEFSIPDPALAVPPVPPVVLPTGAKIWFVAETLAALLPDGDPVTSWPDDSGNGYTAATFGGGWPGNAPAFRAGVVNGLGAVEFDGTNDGLRTNVPDLTLQANAPAVGGPLEWTCFAVFLTDSLSGDQAVVIGDDQTNPPGSARASWYIAIDTTIKSFANNGTTFVRESSGETLTTGTWNLAESWRSTTEVEALLNGVGDGASAVASVTEAGNEIYLGAYSAGSGYFDGKIAEVIGWGRLLTTTERATVRDYLTAKYGL